jgi:hypothetical protein
MKSQAMKAKREAKEGVKRKSIWLKEDTKI